jgi:hypothetical protein
MSDRERWPAHAAVWHRSTTIGALRARGLSARLLPLMAEADAELEGLLPQ